MVLDDPAMVGRPSAPAAGLVIHVPAHLLARHGQAGFGLYGRIAPEFRRMGIAVTFVERPSTTELAGYSKHDFHLVHHGFLRRFNLLNCGIAYVWPYWYLDRRGVLCDSSMANAAPHLDALDPDRAARFRRGLHARTAARGLSKHAQPPRTGALGAGAIVVFLQGLSEPVLRSMFMTETEMLEIVIRHRDTRPVLIKPHPQFPDTIAVAHALRLAGRHPGVSLTRANVHDLLDSAYCSVSICSGASFEGFMHRTPAILFGRSDFAACAWTVRTEAEAARALREIGAQEFDFDRFLYWFLRRKMYSQRNPNLAARVLQRIAQTGFALAPERPLRPLLPAPAEDPRPGFPMLADARAEMQKNHDTPDG